MHQLNENSYHRNTTKMFIECLDSFLDKLVRYTVKIGMNICLSLSYNKFHHL